MTQCERCKKEATRVTLSDKGAVFREYIFCTYCQHKQYIVKSEENQ